LAARVSLILALSNAETGQEQPQIDDAFDVVADRFPDG
jgi:hypothetical protein